MTNRFVPAWSLAVAAGLLAGPSAPAQDRPPTPTPPPSTPPATEPSAREVTREVARDEASKPTPAPVDRIKDEAANRSQVMATLSYLTDVIGPRLTGSPGMKRANEWTRDKMASWGMQNAHLEPWGPFGRSWSLEKFSIQVAEPHCIPLIAFPKAWSPGLDGTATGPLVDFDSIQAADELDKYKGKLKGAFVLLSPISEAKAHFEPEGTRLTDKELLELANAAPEGGRGRGRPPVTPEQRARAALQAKKIQFATDEGAAALLDCSRLGDGGTLFVAQASVPGGPLPGERPDPNARRLSAWDKDAPKLLPQITVAKEHYNRLLRMIRQGESLKVTAELGVKFYDEAGTFNTVAEIPGTDPKLKDEVVMLGGHMDSWHSGTGATDNAAGVSVAMEAARIIRALDLKPKRTIRVALWSGEEQGLYGSRAYVKEHFGSSGDGNGMGGGGGGYGGGNAGGPPPKITTKPEYEKLSGYFNLDNGTGKVRGIYLQGNEAARAVFQPWLAPFREMGASTITISNTGGTDHLSFDAIGLPGFQFIQDVIEYDARTHHSNQDVYDRIQADDMKQASAVMAAFVFNTANRDEKLPRKPTRNLVPADPSSSPTPTPANPPTTPAAASAASAASLR